MDEQQTAPPNIIAMELHHVWFEYFLMQVLRKGCCCSREEEEPVLLQEQLMPLQQRGGAADAPAASSLSQLLLPAESPSMGRSCALRGAPAAPAHLLRLDESKQEQTPQPCLQGAPQSSASGLEPSDCVLAKGRPGCASAVVFLTLFKIQDSLFSFLIKHVHIS